MERRHRSLVSINVSAAAAEDADDGLGVSYCLVFNSAPTPERGACDLCVRAGAYVRRADRKLSRSLPARSALYGCCTVMMRASLSVTFQLPTLLHSPYTKSSSVSVASAATVCSRMKNVIRRREMFSAFH